MDSSFGRGGSHSNRGEKRKFDREAGPSGSGRGGGAGFGRGFARPAQGGEQGMPMVRRDRIHVYESRLRELGEATLDLPPIDVSEKKFSSRNKLFIGNIDSEMTESDLKKLLEEHGSIDDLFYQRDKRFAFVKFDFRSNADACRKALNRREGKDGRSWRCNYAPNNAAVKVKNLGPLVSNELLFKAFSIFGPIERAVVAVDEKGNSTGEGIVDFISKKSALDAMHSCQESHFVLSRTLKPVIVEPYEAPDEDGVPEANLFNHEDYRFEREVGPRFTEPDSFEFEFCEKYKQLALLRKQKMESLEREMQLEEKKLWAQMEMVRYQHETELLRKKLQQREEERERSLRMFSQREMEMERELEAEREHQKRREAMFDFNVGSNVEMELLKAEQEGNILEANKMKMMMMMMMQRRGQMMPDNGAAQEVFQDFIGEAGKRPRFPHEVFGRGGGNVGGGRSRRDAHKEAEGGDDLFHRRDMRTRSRSGSRDMDMRNEGGRPFGRGGRRN